MGFKERYCVQLLRRILKGKSIFSFLLASWNAACDRKRMTAILDYLVSLDTTEQQDRRGLEPDSRKHHDCYRLAVFQKRKLPSPLSRGESGFSDIHYTNRKKHRTQTDIFPKKIYTNGHQVCETQTKITMRGLYTPIRKAITKKKRKKTPTK